MDSKLNVKTEALENDQVKMTVTIPADMVDDYIAKEYKAAAKKYRFPGFRPGKAPRKVIDSSFGGASAMLAQTTDTVLNETYTKALVQESLRPIKDPDFGKDASTVKDGAEYTYDVTLTLAPKVELSSYDPVEVELPAEEATQEDIDAQVNGLKEYYFSFKDITDRPVEKGDFAVLDIAAEGDEGPIEALSSEGRIYELGVGSMPEEFDEQVIGTKIGATKKFDLEIEEDGNVHFAVTVGSIRVKEYPPTDDDFAKKAGFESLDDLNKRMTEAITKQKTEMMPRIKEQECLYALMERAEVEPPQELVQDKQQQLLQTFFMNLQNSQTTFDQYLMQRGITAEQLQSDLAEQAVDTVKQDLALDSLADHLKLEVTQKDLDKEFAASGADDPAALQQKWVDEGRIIELKDELRRAKAADWLVENAKVSTKKEDAPKKKAASKKTTAEKKPAEKKPAAKKAAAKKTDDGEKKPAAKKAAAKKPAAKKTDDK